MHDEIRVTDRDDVMREGFTEVDDTEGCWDRDIPCRCPEGSDFCVFGGFLLFEGGFGGEFGGWRGMTVEQAEF